MSRTDDGAPTRFELERPLPVQGYDIDVAGIVSNIVYVRWLEDLRQAFCDTYYPTSEMMAQGFLPALIETQVSYKRAVRFGDRVVGTVRFEGFRGPRWNFGFEVRANDAVAATAKQVGVLFNLADATLRRIPDDMFDRFGRLQFERPGNARGGGQGRRAAGPAPPEP